MLQAHRIGWVQVNDYIFLDLITSGFVDNIFVSENFNTQEEADLPQNIPQNSLTNPVFVPTLPMPIASSQIKNKGTIRSDSLIGKISS